jgi:hypothetical protein
MQSLGTANVRVWFSFFMNYSELLVLTFYSIVFPGYPSCLYWGKSLGPIWKNWLAVFRQSRELRTSWLLIHFKRPTTNSRLWLDEAGRTLNRGLQQIYDIDFYRLVSSRFDECDLQRVGFEMTRKFMNDPVKILITRWTDLKRGSQFLLRSKRKNGNLTHFVIHINEVAHEKTHTLSPTTFLSR